MRMDDQNKKLAHKNTLLKQEIDRLVEQKTMILRENLKVKYYSNRLYKRIIGILDESIINMVCSVEKLKDFHKEIMSIAKEDDKKAIPVEADSDHCASTGKQEETMLIVLKDKTNEIKPRKKGKRFFDRSRNTTTRTKNGKQR